MKPMYQDEECTPSEGVSQSPADFKGKMVKIPTEKDKILELYPGKLQVQGQVHLGLVELVLVGLMSVSWL